MTAICQLILNEFYDSVAYVLGVLNEGQTSVKTHIAQIITLLGITSPNKQVKKPVTFCAQLLASFSHFALFKQLISESEML